MGVSEPNVPAGAGAPSPEQRERALAECERLRLHFAKRGSRNKSVFQWLKYSSIGLTVGVTVLASFPSNPVPWVLPVVAGLAAICTALLSATHAQELWVISRTVQMRLQSEQFQYLQGVGRYAELNPEEGLRVFSERIMEIWGGGQGSWAATVAEKASGQDRQSDSDGNRTEPGAAPGHGT